MFGKKKEKIIWMEEEQTALQKLFLQYGCSWALISKFIPKHNDTQIKNKFYSTLRKGLRKINEYIGVNKKNREKILKIIETDIIKKLMAVADKNYQEKLQVRPTAQCLAPQIISKLINLAKENKQYSEIQKHMFPFDEEESLINQVKEFKKNCRMRRAKTIEKRIQSTKIGRKNHCLFKQNSEEEIQEQQYFSSKQQVERKQIQKKVSEISLPLPEYHNDHQKWKSIPEDMFESTDRKIRQPLQLFNFIEKSSEIFFSGVIPPMNQLSQSFFMKQSNSSFKNLFKSDHNNTFKSGLHDSNPFEKSFQLQHQESFLSTNICQSDNPNFLKTVKVIEPSSSLLTKNGNQNSFNPLSINQKSEQIKGQERKKEGFKRYEHPQEQYPNQQ